LKTTPIPVKFDRQGHSCNFYAAFGPTSVVEAWRSHGLPPMTRLAYARSGTALTRRSDLANDCSRSLLTVLAQDHFYSVSKCLHLTNKTRKGVMRMTNPLLLSRNVLALP
jgi:hypothetical protein